MARVTHVKKAQKPQGSCEVCHAPIEEGQAYKWTKPRSHRGAVGYKRKRHEGCRSWRPSETTSSAALAAVYGAQEAAEDALASWDREDLTALGDIIETLAEGLREGAEVWRESASKRGDSVTTRPLPTPAQTGRCQWFLLCENPATHDQDHPILGPVPTCDRCASRLGLPR